VELVYGDGLKCEQDMIVYTVPRLDAFVTYPQLPIFCFCIPFHVSTVLGEKTWGHFKYCTSRIRNFPFYTCVSVGMVLYDIEHEFSWILRLFGFLR